MGWDKILTDKFIEEIEHMLSKKNLSYSILILGVMLSFLILFVTQKAYLFENADLYKFSLVASRISPYSVLPWQAPYPPFYFIMWLLPYIIITSITHNISQAYFGFKFFSLIIIYITTFILYKSQQSNKGYRYTAVSLSSLFLISAQYSLFILTGDSVGFLLLSIGAFFLINNRDHLGLFFVLLSALFKLQPLFGVVFVFVFLARYEVKKFNKEIIIAIFTIITFLVIPLLTLFSDSFQAFLAFDYGNLQLYNFNVYSGVADLSSIIFHLNIVLVSQFLSDAWILILLITTLLFTYSIFSTKIFKKARPIDILAVGILIWIILFKQTLPYYFLWPSVVLIATSRIRSFLFLLCGEIFGILFFIFGYALLGSTPTNYAIPPPLGVSILFFMGGLLFLYFGFLALKQLVIDIQQDVKHYA